MRRRARFTIALAGAAILGGASWLLAARLEDTFYVPLDDPAIQYAQPTSEDPVARLEKRLENGQAKLDYAPNGWGYLPSVLKQLGISPGSQLLVLSKTSIQSDHISPRTPRALYFNDSAAVGYVQRGDVLELSSLDPKQGVIFYSLENKPTAKPAFDRRPDCLQCHQGAATLGIPGLLVSSIHPAAAGAGEMHGSAFVTDDRTPIEERWGGWYVTGTTGSQSHYGNNPALVDPAHPGGPAGPEALNLTSLTGLFDTSKYLEPTSDVVALMTLEHQARMINLMTRIGWDARIAERGKMDDAARKQIDSEIEDMLSYMLFVDEAPLKQPVTGVSDFTKTFPELGPKDSQGRSLRDFDLKTRLFRYPLSYMIYSPAFDGMPEMVRQRVYRRLYAILTGQDQSGEFAHIPADSRRAILEIVRQTKANLPAYWTAAPK